MNENVLEKITYNEYKDVLLNKVKIIDQELMKPTKCFCLALMDYNYSKQLFLLSYFVKLLLIFGPIRTVPYTFFFSLYKMIDRTYSSDRNMCWDNNKTS